MRSTWEAAILMNPGWHKLELYLFEWCYYERTGVFEANSGCDRIFIEPALSFDLVVRRNKICWWDNSKLIDLLKMLPGLLSRSIRRDRLVEACMLRILLLVYLRCRGSEWSRSLNITYWYLSKECLFDCHLSLKAEGRYFSSSLENDDFQNDLSW